MKKNLLMSILLAAVATTATADTFVVSSDKGTSSDDPKLAVSHGVGACVYADKAVQPRDTLVMAEMNIVLVCVKSLHGSVFYPLSPFGAAEVIEATPKARG